MANQSRLTIQVIFNRLPTLQKNVKRLAILGIDKGAARMQTEGKSNSPYKTGALRASIYRVTPVHNDYAVGVSRMLRLNPRAIPVPEPSVPEDGAYLGAAANYGLYVHQGHRTRNGGSRAGRPFLMEAILSNQNLMVQYVKESIEAVASGRTVAQLGTKA